MKLTLKQLEIILKDNETQLKAENSLLRTVELLNHRAIVKDCIIEVLKDKLESNNTYYDIAIMNIKALSYTLNLRNRQLKKLNTKQKAG